MRKTILAILLALALVLIPVSTALAQTVTVTAVPGVLSLTITDKGGTPLVPDWPINGLTGDGVIRPATLYFSNPLGDETVPNVATPGDVDSTECYLIFTNESNVPINITCDMSDFSGGDTMDNSDTAGYLANGLTDFGASGYEEGLVWPTNHVPFLTTSSGTFITNLLALPGDNTRDWGVALTTRSSAFTSITPIQSTITATASYYGP